MVKSLNKTKLLLSISATAVLIGCSTSIVERSPLDIASNSLRRTDSYSGASEVLAPQIKAFSSNRTSVKGEVQLRTAGPFVDNNGILHRDGAFLEIVVNYATATPDPDGGLYFDQVNWAGGEAAQIADFGAAVLDCKEDVREIYRVPIGYTGYGHYGRYGRNGHSGYRGYNRHGRRGGHYGGYYGYGYGYGYGRNNDERRGDGADTDQPTDDSSDNMDVPAATPRTGPGRRDLTEDRSRVPAERDPVRSDSGRSDQGWTGPNAEPPSRKQPRWRAPTSTIKSEHSGRSSRATRPTPAVRTSPPKAAPVSRPSPPPPPPPVRRQSSSPKNTSRSVDRAFKNTNNSRTRAREKVKTQMRYDPRNTYDPGYTDYVVSYSCQRQETVRVFIPRERLLGAEKNGLLLYLNPRNGIEETVVLPPNYISGFLLAAYSSDGKRITIDGDPPANATMAPEVEPSPRTPIIYGGN